MTMPTLTAPVSISTLTISAGASVSLAGFSLTLSSFTNAGALTQDRIRDPGAEQSGGIHRGPYRHLRKRAYPVHFTYQILQINGNNGTFNVAALTASTMTIAAGAIFNLSGLEPRWSRVLPTLGISSSTAPRQVQHG